jgi:signal transduction histidine kinase
MSQQYAAKKSAEKEADIKRLGVKSNISDLEHLLQTTQANIGGIIYDLGKLYPEDEKYHSLVKGLNDNVEYMNRVIRFSNATINKDMFNLKLQDLDQFIKSYCSAWLNYSGNYFNLSLKSNLGGNNMVMFDKTYLKLMLDSILTNVERHGFKKQRRDENLVEISLSLESYANKPYVVLRVANNGLPFKKGFTLDDYKQRGRYSGNTGRSGLGGYHVFEIAKGHNGFLYIDSNKVWNVVVEVLLPIDNVESDNLTVYEHECI